MTFRIKFISLLCILSLSLLGLMGCSNESNSDKTANNNDTNELPNPAPNPENVEGKEPAGIVAGEITAKLFDLGNEKFQYQIKNQTEKVKTLKFTSSQRFDYAVKTEDGKQLFLFSSVASFIKEDGVETLKQGEELNYTFDLSSLGLKKGKYILEVWMTPAEGDNFRIVTDYIVD